MAYQTDDKRRDNSIPCGKRLHSSVVRKGRTINAFRLQATIEANIGDADAKPGHETSNRCHVGKPSKDHSGTAGYSHERKRRKQGAEDDRDVGETRLGRPRKNCRCITSNSQAICSSTWSSQPL